MDPIELNFTVDLAKKETQVIRDLSTPLYYGDSNAHTINVTVLRDGVPEDLSNVTPCGYVVFENTGETVELSGTSSKSGNIVTVTLSDEAYAVTGRAYIVIRLSNDEHYRSTIFAVYCWIGLGVTDTIVVPSGSRLDIDELNRKINEFEQAVEDISDLADEMRNAVDTIDDIMSGVRPEKYGAVGDGVTDDTNALLEAFQYAWQHRSPIILGAGKTYLTSRTLFLYDRIQIYGNQAIIKATATISQLIYWSDDITDTGIVPIPQFPEAKANAMIENLTLDGNANAGTCLFIGCLRGVTIRNVDICGFTTRGIYDRSGFEHFFDGVRIAGTGAVGETGIYINGLEGDSRYVNVVTKNCEIGIDNYGGSNTFVNLHSWNIGVANIPTSVMLKTSTPCRCEGCYADNVAVAFDITQNVELTAEDTFILHKGNGWTGTGNPVVFRVVSAEQIDKIKSVGMQYLTPTYDYDLFSVAPGDYGRSFDWRGNNATSIQVMGNFPGEYVVTPEDLAETVDEIVTGNHPDMTAGSAEQLISTVGETDKVPYNFRASGGGVTVGDREMDEIVGGTIFWNQQNKDIAEGSHNKSSDAGIESFSISNGIISFLARAQYAGVRQSTITGQVLKDHVYLRSFDVMMESIPEFTPANARIYWPVHNMPESGINISSLTAGVWANCSSMKRASADKLDQFQCALNDERASGYSEVKIRNWMHFDLTQMFGDTIADYIYSLETATAGAGVAWFRKLFPKPYYSYNAGELMSVQAAAHETVGFNAFDKDTSVQNGTVDASTGAFITASGRWRSNYIPVVSGMTYCLIIPSTTSNHFVAWYTAGKAFIERSASSTNAIRTVNAPANAAYAIITKYADVDGKDTRDGTCFNLSLDGERNGEYEPYVKRTYPLDSRLTLRGIPKLDANNKLYYDGDTYESDGTVTRRYGVVADLGELTWYYAAASETKPIQQFYAGISDAKREFNLNCFTPAYTTNRSPIYARDTDKTVCTYNKRVYICDSAYTDAATFKAAMSGVMLVYELATPIIETADQYTTAQTLSEYGTEEYIDAGTRDVAIPVGHDTLYPANLRAKIEEAPDSPNADGDYIVRRANGQNTYTPLILPSGGVSYDTEQTLTDAQKAQVRTNIGAASENLEGVTLISGTYSGTKSLSITQAFTAGTYRITAQSITSADTDADTCMVMFMDSSTEVLGFQMARGTNSEAYAVVPGSGTRVVLYASKNWAAGDGDTFSFSGLKIEKVAPLVYDMFGMESAVKPMLFGSWQGTLSKSIVMDFPEGDYFIQIDKITSSDTAYEQSAISFTDSSNDTIMTLLFQRNRPQYRSFHIPSNAAKIFMFASTDYPKSSGKEFNYINLKIWKVNRRLLDDSLIPTPSGFSWTNHPLDGYLRRTENGIVCDMDVRAMFRPKSGMTYWVATDGDDSNPGYSSSAPLRTIGAALGKSNAVIIRIKDGFYDADTVPGHVSSFSRSVAVVANDGAHPVIASSNGASTWTLTSGKTYTHQTAADSNAVWDIGNSMAYTRVDSAAEVESTEASYYCDGTDTYVHTKDGTSPTSDIRCCLASDNFRITTSGKPALYFEGLTIVGGDSGAFRVTCDGTNRPKVYAKNCTFIGAAAWGACYLEGCEAILQNCEATGSKVDGFGIHRNNTTGTISPRHVEINCHGHHNGVTGNTTSNGSTVHAAGYVIRVNGDYHHNVGPNVADVHDGTQVWNLGCHAWSSLIGTDTTGNSDFLISDATTGENAMWLDNCSGYGSKYSMCANSKGIMYVRGGTYETVHVSTGGHMESY